MSKLYSKLNQKYQIPNFSSSSQTQVPNQNNYKFTIGILSFSFTNSPSIFPLLCCCLDLLLLQGCNLNFNRSGVCRAKVQSLFSFLCSSCAELQINYSPVYVKSNYLYNYISANCKLQVCNCNCNVQYSEFQSSI